MNRLKWIIILVRPLKLFYTCLHRHEPLPLVGSIYQQKVWPLILTLLGVWLAISGGLFFGETMALMSAKPTQFSIPLCHFFPAIYM